MHLTYLSSLLIAGLLAPTAISAPLSGSRLGLKARGVAIGAEEDTPIQADNPSPPAANPPAPKLPPDDRLQAEIAHFNDDGDKNVKRGTGIAAELEPPVQAKPPSPPSAPKPAPASPPSHADPGNANSGATSKEAEDILQASIAHDDGTEK